MLSHHSLPCVTIHKLMYVQVQHTASTINATRKPYGRIVILLYYRTYQLNPNDTAKQRHWSTGLEFKSRKKIDQDLFERQVPPKNLINWGLCMKRRPDMLKRTSSRYVKYQLLNAVEIVVRDFRSWKTDSPKSELAHLRKFEGLLDIILDDTELILSDGESVCASTRDTVRSIIDEDESTEFGRRIDLLVNCSRLGVTVELCSIEFKKQDASTSVVNQQQSKNARINSCILSSINTLLRSNHNQVLSFDFVGSTGYMTQMFYYEDVIFSQKIADICVPTDIFELDALRNTLKYLYLWKSYLVQLSSIAIKS